MRKLLRLALLVFFVATLFSFLGSRPPAEPIVWEREGAGAFERTGGSSMPSLALYSSSTETHSGKATSTNDPDYRPIEQPTRASSFTIVGLGPEGHARQIAAGIAADLRELDTTKRVDVRFAGDRPEDDLLGDQILLFEVHELNCTSAATWSPLGWWDAVVDGWMGHVPEFGWGEDHGMAQRATFDWDIELETRVVGLPFSGRTAFRSAVSGAFEMREVVDTLHEDGDVVPPFPRALVFETTDLGTSAEAALALGATDPPVYAGRRHLRKGEALWRTEGPDAPERLEAAIETLKAQGWEEGAGGSSKGVDGFVHLYTLRRGDEFVRLQYHENRIERFQQVSWTSSWTPEGGSTPQVKHVEGEPLDPVVWLYYRHEASAEELRTLHGRAAELGNDVRAAFEANLPLSRRAELGLDAD